MNRILQADVIVTLSRDQAETLLTMVKEHRSFEHSDDVLRDMCGVRAEVVFQCAKQGVQL